ncbi:CaiB/BaiF CoA transferase family protein [Nonomuraea muscovyensis]|uniref:Formyl-CoA transferase n=1 Tax=Nonomuraea muscovyensis TaxID=1124761 RepID=A0A7X0C3B5_9ACTN|nr:CoA transferase [Nonomuraea muscovyensis]MBB6347770.1 formyl-CoA transferase [Nonomuraea muscovyensis]
MNREEFFRDARSDLTGPLDGVRVLDVTKVWSGPMATCVLADLGADVVRVELPGGLDGEVPPKIPGTGLSWFRQTVNRNKRSVGLDLREKDGRETFLRMVAVSDVVVENYRPGTLDGWGAGYAACRAAQADIVFVSISGYGQYGPRSSLPGYDPVLQAYGGWMSLNGEPGGGPVRAQTFIADEMAGLHGAIGALAALRHRDRTGEGQHVDVAMLDALLAGSSGLLTLAATGRPPARNGNETDFVVPANVYACADGSIYLAVALNRQWRALAAAIGRPELATAPGFGTAAERLANRAAVNEAVAAWCAERGVEQVLKALDACAVPAAQVRDLADVAADPQVAEREMLQDVTLHDGTTAPLTGPPAKFSRTPTRIRRAAPRAGNDTEDVLREWGLA